MARKPCQCGSNCHNIGCLDCCDCGAQLVGPVERALRSHPGPDAPEEDFFEWAWGLKHSELAELELVSPFDAVSNVYVPGPVRRLGMPGFGITLHSGKGRIRDAISEAIEAAEALGL